MDSAPYLSSHATDQRPVTLREPFLPAFPVTSLINATDPQLVLYLHTVPHQSPADHRFIVIPPAPPAQL